MGRSGYLWSEEADFEIKRHLKKHHKNWKIWSMENLENMEKCKIEKWPWNDQPWIVMSRYAMEMKAEVQIYNFQLRKKSYMSKKRILYTIFILYILFNLIFNSYFVLDTISYNIIGNIFNCCVLSFWWRRHCFCIR